MSRIDTSHRPETYFRPISLDEHVRTRVKGQVRRNLAASLAGEGRTDLLPGLLTEEDLGEEDLSSWGSIHPWCLGGEFLPRFRRMETEIARVVLRSTTCDVTSVYARRLKNRIAYRVVDEYDGEMLTAKTRRTSTCIITEGFPIRSSPSRPLWTGKATARKPARSSTGASASSGWRFASRPMTRTAWWRALPAE